MQYISNIIPLSYDRESNSSTARDYLAVLCESIKHQ